MGGLDNFVQEAMLRPHTTQVGFRGGERKRDSKDTKRGGRRNKN